MEWRHRGSPRPKKFWVQKFAGKVLAPIFWDQDGILLIGCLPKDQTIDTEYYSSLLMQLKNILKVKRGERSTTGSCSCTTMPRLTGHLQPRRNWPTWASIILITHPILRIWQLYLAFDSLVKSNDPLKLRMWKEVEMQVINTHIDSVSMLFITNNYKLGKSIKFWDYVQYI